MRENRITINVTFWITLTTFIGATYFCLYENLNMKLDESFVVYITNLSFAIFGSSLLALIVALSGYFSARKLVLKQYLDTLIDVLDALGSYRQFSTEPKGISHNTKVVDDLIQLRLKLSKIYYDYSPFRRKHNKLNSYVYASMKYIENFTREAYKHTSAINELINSEPEGQALELLLDEITEVEKYMFTINTKKQGEEVTTFETSFVMRKNLINYVNEYIQVINGEHNGNYSEVVLPLKEELKNNKIALLEYYQKLFSKNTLHLVGVTENTSETI